MKIPFVRINNGSVYTNLAENMEYSEISKLVNPAMEYTSDKWISHNVQRP